MLRPGQPEEGVLIARLGLHRQRGLDYGRGRGRVGRGPGQRTTRQGENGAGAEPYGRQKKGVHATQTHASCSSLQRRRGAHPSRIYNLTVPPMYRGAVDGKGYEEVD